MTEIFSGAKSSKLALIKFISARWSIDRSNVVALVGRSRRDSKGGPRDDLMHILTRLHNTFAMATAQVLGSMASILARASALESCGEGSAFRILVVEGLHGLKSHWFWVCLTVAVDRLHWIL